MEWLVSMYHVRPFDRNASPSAWLCEGKWAGWVMAWRLLDLVGSTSSAPATPAVPLDHPIVLRQNIPFGCVVSLRWMTAAIASRATWVAQPSPSFKRSSTVTFPFGLQPWF